MSAKNEFYLTLKYCWVRHNLSAYVLLLLTTWISHFFYFRNFGLYEDDYAFIGYAMDLKWNALLGYIKSCFMHWPQGRPVGFALSRIITFIGTRLGGLQVVYLFGFLIVTVNSFLFYSLLKKRFPERLAFFSALAFCLFPADTTKTLLTHNLILQSSLMFMLIASCLYLAGKGRASYIVILSSLLSYESGFLPFLAIPLLKRRWDKALLLSLTKHIITLGFIIACIVIIRNYMGESRINDVNLSIIRKLFFAVIIGPFASMASFAYGPLMSIKALTHGNYCVAFAGSGCLIAFFCFFYRSKCPAIGRMTICSFAFESNPFRISGNFKAPKEFLEICRGILVGTIMLFVAYLLSFTHFPPTTLSGRGTSVHLAATFGAALVWGASCYAVFLLLCLKRLKSLGIMAIALYFALLVGYRFVIQHDFKQSWKNQSWFWTSVVEKCPDLSDGTMIFVLQQGLPRTKYIQSNSWADPIVLEQIFQFPESWKTAPRLFVVNKNWAETIVTKDDVFRWKVPTATWWSYWTNLPQNNVILLKMVDGELSRCYNPLCIGGKMFPLKRMPTSALTSFKRGQLFDYLIQRKHNDDIH